MLLRVNKADNEVWCYVRNRSLRNLDICGHIDMVLGESGVLQCTLAGKVLWLR